MMAANNQQIIDSECIMLHNYTLYAVTLGL